MMNKWEQFKNWWNSQSKIDIANTILAIIVFVCLLILLIKLFLSVSFIWAVVIILVLSVIILGIINGD